MTTTQTPVSPTTSAPPQVATTTLSTVALIAGIASIVFGQTFFLPLGAVILGILGYRQEPYGRTFAVWGIVLGALALVGWALVGIIGFAIAAPFLWFAAF